MNAPIYVAHGTGRKGFSLIELLVVIGVLVIVMAIILPVLGHARNSARKASTATLIADLNTAVGAFRNENRRDPGYFSLTDMGNSANINSGFTMMSNVLLDLCGGLATGREDTTPTDPVVNVGPHSSAQVLFDKRLMAIDDKAKAPGSGGGGGSGGGYFRPGSALVDWKFFEQVKGSPSTLGLTDVQQRKYIRSENNMVMPDLVDAWGTPILAWGIDTSAKPDYANGGVFGAQSFAETGPRPFVYWAQNAAFLRAIKIASRSGTGPNQQELSLLGSANTTNATTLSANLEALLGHPSYPVDPPTTPAHAVQARGPLVFHSAGGDAVYMSKEDRGGKIATAGASAYTSADGLDAMNAFDDLLFSAGQ